MIRRITLFALPLVISGTLAHAELGPKKPSELVNAVAFRGFSDTCCSSSETAFDLTFNADGKRTESTDSRPGIGSVTRSLCRPEAEGASVPRWRTAAPSWHLSPF